MLRAYEKEEEDTAPQSATPEPCENASNDTLTGHCSHLPSPPLPSPPLPSPPLRPPPLPTSTALLTQPLSSDSVDDLLQLTKTSPVGVAFSSSAPEHWQEITLQQFHRRTPLHMHGPAEQGRLHSHTTRVWQYQPPSGGEGGRNRQSDNTRKRYVRIVCLFMCIA